MQVNNIFKPLVERFINVNNYEKMRSILDIGFSGLEVIEKYYIKQSDDIENNEYFQKQVKDFQNKIKDLNNTIETINNNALLEKQQQQDTFNKTIRDYNAKIQEYINITNRLNIEKQEITDGFHVKINSVRDEVERNYIDNINNKSHEVEILRNEIMASKEHYANKIQNMMIEYNGKNDVIRENYTKEINKVREDNERNLSILKISMASQETNYKRMLEIEKENIISSKQKIIDELTKDNERYKNKYECLEVNSVLKGKPYENAIEAEMTEFFEKNDNIYSIKRCSTSKGKGDFVITNNYTGKRIMLEAKNTPKVSSTVNEQQPKFYKDVRDKTNNYDGGIIVSSGTIDGKRNYQFEILDDGKVVSFIENYNLNNPANIHLIIQVMHDKIKEIDEERDFSKDKILNIQVELYKSACESLKKTKTSYDTQRELVEKMKDNILCIFNIDVDEYINDKKKSEDSLNKGIKETIEKYVKETIESDKTMKKKDLKERTVNEFKEYIDLYKIDKSNGISKNAIENLIKKYKY